jgi:tRNA-dihydrouridine synthase
MRIGWDDRQKERAEYLNFLKMFEDLGIAAVTIHPRTRSQQYSGSADWSYIKRAVQLGMKYPIIGNGDVKTPQDAERMVAETGCDGVMIGRGILYNPFLFRQIADDSLPPSNYARIAATIRYFEIVLKLNDERDALHKIKKFTGLFTKGIQGASALRQKLNALNDPKDILKELETMAEKNREGQ